MATLILLSIIAAGVYLCISLIAYIKELRRVIKEYTKLIDKQQQYISILEQDFESRVTIKI